MSGKRIFVSHISSETELAQQIKAYLDKHFLGMLDIFVSSDRETIRAGSKWLDAVDTALKSADLQIILCSLESVGRPWVNFEAGAAWLRGIPVIPCCHSGMLPNHLPAPLGMLQAVECSQADGLRKLYDAIAENLEVNVPDIDFEEMASALSALEKQPVHTGENFKVKVIENPKILCAASEQYAQMDIGFDRDVKILESAFPNLVTVEKALTQKRLRELLITESFDIIHLVLAVDPNRGNLIFSKIASTTDYIDDKPSPDYMPPEGFSALLAESKTSLVVLACCESLFLAVKVAEVANMVASETIIQDEEVANWEECFYGLITKGVPLFKAFKLTSLQTESPMSPVRHNDLVFALKE